MDDDPLAELTRWVDSGGTWKLIRDSDNVRTIALYTCDGGEEMHRINISDPAIEEWIAANTT